MMGWKLNFEVTFSGSGVVNVDNEVKQCAHHSWHVNVIYGQILFPQEQLASRKFIKFYGLVLCVELRIKVRYPTITFVIYSLAKRQWIIIIIEQIPFSMKSYSDVRTFSFTRISFIFLFHAT